MTVERITMLPPVLVVTVHMPRFYGLRLLVASWCIAAAGWVAGGAIEVVMSDGAPGTKR